LNEILLEDDDYVIELDDDDESDVESMDSDATELLLDKPGLSESYVEATEDEFTHRFRNKL
jgi:hypothetical protein